MGTPANIIIEFENDSFLLPKGRDQILLFCSSDGYPFYFDGAMYLVVKAYEDLKNTRKYSENSNVLTPDSFASELIRISFYEKYGYCRIIPATRLMFEQYDKVGYFVDKAYKYVCNFKSDDHWSYDMTLTLKDNNNETTKSMNEWGDVCKIAFQIAHVQNESAVLMNNNVPCKKCIVRATCVNYESGILFVNDICEDLKKHKKNENIRLRRELPDWATAFV